MKRGDLDLYQNRKSKIKSSGSDFKSLQKPGDRHQTSHLT